MAKVAFVVDSTACIPQDYLEEYGIQVVPSLLIWGGKAYQDGLDIHPDEFYERLTRTREMPTTAAPNPATFQEKFLDLLEQGKDVLGVFLSQKVSAVYANALAAADALAADNLIVVDSRSGGMALGWAVIRAARAAEAGAPLAKCAEIVDNALKQTGFLATLDTLKYLQRGGRIGSAERWLGMAINLKPIVGIIDGELAGIERVRTRRRALERMIEMMEVQVAGRRPISLAILHTNATAEAQALLEDIHRRLALDEWVIASVSPTVGAHFGPGALGLTFLAGGNDKIRSATSHRSRNDDKRQTG